MKAFILGLLVSLSTTDRENKVADDYSWVLDEMNAEVEIATDLRLDEHQIKVFDLEWNLVGEYAHDKFIENELSLPELKAIMESEFLFTYQGDSYYLKR